MFTLKLSDTYKWPVKITIPADDGKFETVQFKAVFKRKKQDEIEQLLTTPGLTDTVFAKSVMVGVDDIQDEAGNAITADDLLEVAGAATSIAKAYMASLEGAPRKN